MTTHVFIGAGPANLHRALKIKKMDPEAQIVIIDNRLRPETRDIDREKARANIFRFENNVVTEKLLADGVDKDALARLTYDRDFSVRQGFQHGDDTVFSANRFTQIQIRDLQLLLLQTLDKLPGPPPVLLSDKINVNSFERIEQSVAQVLHAHQGEIELGRGTPDIQIHSATGALKDAEEKAAIIYPDKATHQIHDATSDVAAMPITPKHGTTTFFIKDPTHGAQLVSCRELEADQRSLDLTEWQPVLEGHGWNLIRPPRIRVFYANDVLYIGAEIPAKMVSMDDEAYETAMTDYTRAIASLVFPHTAISELPVNPHLRSRFPTERGERGEVLSLSHSHTMAWGEGERKAHISLFNHGDSRYLPHYQTGSGFVTGFLINEVYADIYQHKTFHDLYAWAMKNGHLGKGVSEEKVKAQYTRVLKQGGDKVAEEHRLQAFQTELFMALSRDIIDENKAKVGRYFNAIHSQSLAALKDHFEDILALYNRTHATQLETNDFVQLDKSVVVMQMLKENNINFLREMMPRLLNKDFSEAEVDDNTLLHIRDIHLLDFKRNLPTIKNIHHQLDQCDVLFKKEDVLQSLKGMSAGQFSELLTAFNKANGSHYKPSQFPVEHRLIVVMEMLNRNGHHLVFLRYALPQLLGKKVSAQDDKAIFALRDKLTGGYMKYVDQPLVNQIATQWVAKIDQLVMGEVEPTASISEKFLTLSIRVAKANIQGLLADLGMPVIAKEEDRQALSRALLPILSAKVAEKGIKPGDLAHFLPQTEHILQMQHADLLQSLKNIANGFAAKKELYQRATLSFFPGKHSGTIMAFVKELRDLDNHDLTPEQLKFRAVDALQRFNDKIEAGHSVRTMHFFNEVMAAHFPPLPHAARQTI